MPMTTASTGSVLEVRRQARGTALAEQHQLADARPTLSTATIVFDAGAKLRRVLVIHQLRPQQQQLAAVHGRVFLRCDDRTFNSGKEHRSDT